jgi:protein SCO1
MSNNLTNSQPQAAPAARKMRRLWLVSGLILWGLVFVAAAGLIALKHRQQPAQDDEKPPVLILSDSKSAAATVPAKATTDAAPGVAASGPASLHLKTPWNPAGIEDFTFTERSGKKVTKADLLGHPWLISFIFTRCAGPCPRVTAQMSELQTLLKGSDVRLVSLTVDPDHDTTSVLSHYADAYRADPNRWLYLTGDKKKTYRLIIDSFLMPVQEMEGKDREPGYEVLHSTNILLVNEKGVVVQKYNATDADEMNRLRRDLKPYLAKRK